MQAKARSSLNLSELFYRALCVAMALVVMFRVLGGYRRAVLMHKVADDTHRFFPAGLQESIAWLRKRDERPIYVASTKPDDFTVQRVTEMMYPVPVLVCPPAEPPPGALVVMSIDRPAPISGEPVFTYGWLRVLRVAP